MLVRTFRLTDKLSNASLKLLVFALGFLQGWTAQLRLALLTTLSALAMTGLSLGRQGYQLGRRLARYATKALNQGRKVTLETTQRALQGTPIQPPSQQKARTAMAQRAAQSRLPELRETTVVADPLIARNRSLSAFIVILLVALIGFLLFSSQDNDTSPLGGFIPVVNVTGNAPLVPVIPTPQDSPTPAPAVFGNVRGTLVFSLRQNGQDDLWALPVGSAQAIRLTDSLEDDRHPAWSPDGTKIAFSSRRGGFWDLYILDLSQGQLRQLTFTPDYEGAPTWSPDGQFIAYEGYSASTQNIDIYIISAEGGQAPLQFTTNPLPDTQPAWSPQGRSIAYVGWRNGSQDILVLSLEGQPENEARNLSDSPNIDETSPAWSPDGTRLAYHARENGIDGIYVRPLEGASASRLIGRGRTPAWNPQETLSLFYAVPQGNGTGLYLGQVENFGVGANAIAFEGAISALAWTLTTHNLSGFDPRIPPLYEERLTPRPDGKYGFQLLNNVNAPDPVLSDAVNDSFEALRARVGQKVGYDLLGTLESAFWRRDRLIEPGESRRNWHYTGRAISLSRDLVLTGNPPPLVVIREDSEIGVTWRIMARVAEAGQQGALGEPLRTLPWDFAARLNDPQAFQTGGRRMTSVPPGYYVDLSQLFEDYGWERSLSDRSWRANFSGVLFWQYQKTDGLTWEAAMAQLYTPQEIEDFLNNIAIQAPTALPTPIPGPGDFATPLPTITPTLLPNITPSLSPTPTLTRTGAPPITPLATLGGGGN